MRGAVRLLCLLTVAGGVFVGGLGQIYASEAQAPLAGRQDTAQSAGYGKLARAERSAPRAVQARAEVAYQAGDWSTALRFFRQVVALDPGNHVAWLRIGNIEHGRRAWLRAATAYRKAARETGSNDATAIQVRAKALLNLALVNIEIADAAIAHFDGLASGQRTHALVQKRAELARASSRSRMEINRRMDLSRQRPSSARARQGRQMSEPATRVPVVRDRAESPASQAADIDYPVDGEQP